VALSSILNTRRSKRNLMFISEFLARKPTPPMLLFGERKLKEKEKKKNFVLISIY